MAFLGHFDLISCKVSRFWGRLPCPKWPYEAVLHEIRYIIECKLASGKEHAGRETAVVRPSPQRAGCEPTRVVTTFIPRRWFVGLQTSSSLNRGRGPRSVIGSSEDVFLIASPCSCTCTCIRWREGSLSDRSFRCFQMRRIVVMVVHRTLLLLLSVPVLFVSLAWPSESEAENKPKAQQPTPKKGKPAPASLSN